MVMETKKKISGRALASYARAVRTSDLCYLLATALEDYYGYERLSSDLREAYIQLGKLAESNLFDFEIVDDHGVLA